MVTAAAVAARMPGSKRSEHGEDSEERERGDTVCTMRPFFVTRQTSPKGNLSLARRIVNRAKYLQVRLCA